MEVVKMPSKTDILRSAVAEILRQESSLAEPALQSLRPSSPSLATRPSMPSAPSSTSVASAPSLPAPAPVPESAPTPTAAQAPASTAAPAPVSAPAPAPAPAPTAAPAPATAPTSNPSRPASSSPRLPEPPRQPVSAAPAQSSAPEPQPQPSLPRISPPPPSAVSQPPPHSRRPLPLPRAAPVHEAGQQARHSPALPSPRILQLSQHPPPSVVYPSHPPHQQFQQQPPQYQHLYPEHSQHHRPPPEPTRAPFQAAEYMHHSPRVQQHPGNVTQGLPPTSLPPSPWPGYNQGAPAGAPSANETPPASVLDAPFPSPNLDHFRTFPPLQDDYNRVCHAIQTARPESLRRAIRVNWGSCLLGSDFHDAFVLNAAMLHMAPQSVKRAFKDFGGKLVNLAPEELVNHLTTENIDALAPLILAKAGDRFLDAALELRLKSIEAKPLINALARAERLGYEPEDIIDDTPSTGQERVIPQHAPASVSVPPMSVPFREPGQASASAPVPLSAPHPAPAPAPASASTQQPAGSPNYDMPEWQCHLCNRLFRNEVPFTYHMKKDICRRVPANPTVGFKCCCEHCGQGFSTTMGRQYHLTNKVCGVGLDVEQQKTAASQLATSPHVATPSRLLPASQGVKSGAPSQAASQASPFSSPASATKARGTADAYAHLTEQQKEALFEELRVVEIAYGDRMREAEKIEDPDARRTKLEGLKNSFGTRQSGVRKKFGVRLRERRTRQQIETERTRMLGLAETNARNLANSINGSPGGPLGSTPSREGHVAKRSRLDGGAENDFSRPKPFYDSDEMADRTRKTPSSASTISRSAAEKLSRAAVEMATAAGAAIMQSSQAHPVELSESSSDNEDIPARLPAAVRQSLDQ